MSVFNNQPDRFTLPPGQTPERRPMPTATPQPSAPTQSASTPAASASAEAQRKVSVLGKTLVFKGELSADEDLILQGRVEGSIHHTQSVTVGIDGVVIGDTHARSIVVEGTVEGDLRGVVSVLIAATATVRGNIAAPRVGIMEGANFNGSVDMTSAQSGARIEPVRSADVGLSERSVEKVLGK
jgi:cytoskeletal protein CcmA (bactofilin family)